VSGELDLAALEVPAVADAVLAKKLLALPGIGPYGAANLMQLLGRCAEVACDTETVRHLKEQHGLAGCNLQNVRKVAAKVRRPATHSTRTACNGPRAA
jgi:endonuclease III